MIREHNHKKCVYDEGCEGSCEHPENEHIEGSCWHIVNAELKDQPTNKKFCQCKKDPKTIKSFDTVKRVEGKGWMEPGPLDIMVTNECSKCGKTALLRVGTTECHNCQNRYI